MRIGIITDAHSNPWGQEAVLNYLRREGIDKEHTLDLGDIVGMFPGCLETVRVSIAEAGRGILGNHDAMLLQYFEDTPQREERIAALDYNRRDISSSSDQDKIMAYLQSLPTTMSWDGVTFVHNSPFHTNPYKETDMHHRFGESMRDPSDKKYDPKTSLLLKLAQHSDQLVIRGHSHSASYMGVPKDLTEATTGCLTKKPKPREGAVSSRGDIWTVPIDPDHNYVLVAASACGANTMFTPDGKLDYRPAGMIVEYDPGRQQGEITFFTVMEGYDHQKFVNSVLNDQRWQAPVFEEARKQIEHLQRGTLLGDH